jgi:UDP-GlcNAc:undecaprenyl-phosphate/decaprenyl-phosphate GlcNAc-1-phosphate transferase
VSDEFRLVAAFGIALVVTAAAVPVAIRVAWRSGFLDRPVGYKKHAEPTPYLGGVAVAAGLLAGAVAFGDGLGEYAMLIACAGLLLAVGVIDDRFTLGVGPRLISETSCALALFSADLGFSIYDSDTLNLLLTVALVIGVINAYNLMDNLDGAAATVALVSAVALGVYLTTLGLATLGAIGLALAGACAGFLPFNLARPSARIFLGDAGSMPIGLIVATLIMNVPAPPGFGWEFLAVALVIVGLPALDTALVIFSRLRRGLAVHRGGRDHLTHRLLRWVASPRRVAVVLATGQAVFAGLAVALLHLDREPALAGSIACVLVAIGIIVAFELPEWMPRPIRHRSTA